MWIVFLRKFKNLFPTQKKSLLTFLKWQLARQSNTWPKWVNNNKAFMIKDRANESELIITFINHATVLIQTQGLNIITDPVFSKRVSPISWLGPKRVKNPGINLNNLPHIDIVLISHDHYDHLDLFSLNQLQQKFKPTIIAGLNINKILSNSNPELKCIELDWWQEFNYNNEVSFHFLPAQHWSGRKAFYGHNSSLWGSFAITTPAGNIYFAGDTAYQQHFKMISQKFGKFRLSLIPIGAYDPRWIMKDSHTNPEEAVLAHIDLKSDYSVPIHYGCFKLTDEAYDQPLIDLYKALLKHNIDSKNFKALSEGESWNIPVKPS